jgi:hypothetical protein
MSLLDLLGYPDQALVLGRSLVLRHSRRSLSYCSARTFRLVPGADIPRQCHVAGGPTHQHVVADCCKPGGAVHPTTSEAA